MWAIRIHYNKNVLEQLLTDWQKSSSYSDHKQKPSDSDATDDGGLTAQSSESENNLNSSIKDIPSECTVNSSDVPNNSISDRQSYLSNDSSLEIDKNSSFPNIQLTSNGNLKDSPISNLGNKLRLRKLVQRRGRPKGTKKKFTEFSGKPDKIYKNKRKNHKNSKESNKKSKIVDSDSDHIASACDLTVISSDSEEEITFINPTARQRSTRASWWLESLQLKQADRDILDSNNWLNDRHIEAVHFLLKKQFPNLLGLQNPIIAQGGTFDIIRGSNMLQILHCGSYKHWVTILTVSAPANTIFVFNSFDEDVPLSVIQQICSIVFCPEENLKIISKPIQIQKGGTDCGLFAIANAVSIASGYDPTQIIYNQHSMRQHLKNCYEHNHLSQFPTCSANLNNVNKSITRSSDLSLICDCRQPKAHKSYWGLPHGPTIKCHICHKSFHKMCVTSKKLKASPFLCSCKCTNKYLDTL